ncbi:hypothetical protein ACTHAM_002400 [Cellulomonas soli]|uniref:hypothetical protein n=1 Tax=Cellulomonas soli TaxID=931535 RepID=UPI003F86B355
MSDGAPALTKLQWQKRLRGADITNTEYRILMTICSYTDKSLSNAHPGWARIVADSCITEKTAKKAVFSLMVKGWLRLVEAGGNQYGKGRANVYALAVPLSTRGVAGAPLDDFPPSPGRGVIDDRRGVIDDQGRGVAATPPSGSTSIRGMHHHSAVQVQRDQLASEPVADDDDPWQQQTQTPTSWLDAIDDYDELEAWLEEDLSIDEYERSTALGMWGSGSHPIAIRNTIIASRRQTA